MLFATDNQEKTKNNSPVIDFLAINLNDSFDFCSGVSYFQLKQQLDTFQLQLGTVATIGM